MLLVELEEFERALAPLERAVPELLGLESWSHPCYRHARSALEAASADSGRVDDRARLERQGDEADLRGARTTNSSPRALNELAWRLLERGPKTRRAHEALAIAALACAKEALAGGPDLWNYLDTLASAQHHVGAAEEALATQRRAVD